MIGPRGCLAASVLIICLLSCSPRKPSAPPASAPRGIYHRFRLESRLLLGEQGRRVQQRVAQTVSGGDIETRQSFSTTWRFAVLGRDAEGGLSMEGTFSACK